MHRLALSIMISYAGATALCAEDVVKEFRDRVDPILQGHCVSCHGGDAPEARLNLTGERTREQLQAEAWQWMRVLERVEADSMPPKEGKPLSKAEKLALGNWVRGGFADLIVEQRSKTGRSKLRRLSRNEYANTVQDLFGIRPPVVRDLPIDGRVDGYDKVSAALPFSPAHAAGYLKIAEQTPARFPLGPLEEQPGETVRLYAFESEASPGHILELDDGWKVSFNTDTMSGPVRRKIGTNNDIPRGYPGMTKPGVYRLRISVYAYQSDHPIPFGIYVGHVWSYPQLLELRKVLEAPPGTPTVLETEVYLRGTLDSDISINDGIRLIPFGLGVPVPKNAQAQDCKGPGLALQWIDVIESAAPAPGDRLLFADIPPHLRDAFRSDLVRAGDRKLNRREIETAARKTFMRVGARLYRRDLKDQEVQSLLADFNTKLDARATIRDAFRSVIAGLMTSPDFLCLVEQPGPLDDFALASRLSYFLWNSAPDEELMQVARQSKLTKPKERREQTERLLKDPRSQRFIKDFTDQWLGLWAIDNTTPDRDLYPEYNDLLKLSSVMETQQTFRSMLDENRSVRDFVAPQWAVVNHELARHYQLPEVPGFELRKVALPDDSHFGGVWTQAATMKVTANGTLTSPVKRGVWVAERLLGITVPPPPPNINPVDPDTRGAKTLREQLELHIGHGSCAACHAKFDPYGFPLESFDVIGNYRTKYRMVDRGDDGKSTWKDGLTVDCASVTPEGEKFSDIRELRTMLAQKPEQIAFGVTRHLLTYATGTPTTVFDQRAIEQIVRQSEKDDFGLRTLIHNIVQSDLFGWK